MDKELKEFIKKISKEQARSLVGKACSQIEVLQKQKISKESKRLLSLQKDLLKELIYQEFRTLRDAITFFSEGREYKKYPIYDPTKKV